MIRVNLMPRTLALAQARHRRVRRWSVSVALAVIALAVTLGRDWFHEARADELGVQAERLIADLAATRAELRAVTAEADQVLTQIHRADALRSKRAWSNILGMLGSCLPPTCWLTSISTDPPRPTGTPLNVAAPQGTASAGTAPGVAPDRKPVITIESPRKLRVAGYATDAAEPYAFVTSLKERAVFQEVTLVRSQREPVLDASYHRFEVLCEW